MGYSVHHGASRGAGSGTFRFCLRSSVWRTLWKNTSDFHPPLNLCLAHPLNRPNRIPQIPPCPVPIHFPSLPLPASLSIFSPQGFGEEDSSTFGTSEEAEGNRDTERQQRYFAGDSAARTLCFHCRRHGFDPWLGNQVLQAVHSGQKKKGLLAGVS